jgi:hypothetical protein
MPAPAVDRDFAAPASDLLRSPADRARLSGPAVRLFMNTAELWSLSVDERRALLGGISRQTYHNWRAASDVMLGRDQLERVSLVLGILKGLRLVFAEDRDGLRWLRAANTDALFRGLSPLALMTEGGIGDLYAVRRYLDAWRGVR